MVYDPLVMPERGLAKDVKPFVNVLPSAMDDPEFQGDGLIRMLADFGLSPEALRGFAERMESTIIAEGIETHLLGRPAKAFG